MDLDKIEKLHELREKGLLTDEEFNQAKARLLDEKPVAAGFSVEGMDSRNYSMFMHFSQLLWFFIPVLSWAVTLTMWMVKKDDTYVDQQGRIIFNWFVSLMIYTVVSGILCFILVGFLLLIVLGICAVVFTVLGAIRARDGIIRNYPLALPLLSLNTELATPKLPSSGED